MLRPVHYKPLPMFFSNCTLPQKLRGVLPVIFLLVTVFNTGSSARAQRGPATAKPRIVNIVNFIRLLEPRDPAITETVLYETVVRQVELMKRHQLKGTFLLQYDALMDSRYQQLLKDLPREQFEIGGWWELPQPLVEKAGLKWRGRYPWDWHADVGFSTGYTPEERIKLVDVYMNDFKAVFGYYPESVGSWFIDERTLDYLYRKYHIVASSNCKDQYGTDGYTLWGGYWNQAYYPSKVNAYMPAQHAKNQIPVPVFRMLGSDPIRQYDDAPGSERQGVVTLEPVYPKAGGDSTWVHWFLKQFVTGACMDFAYTQAGQENSFTWDAMSTGLGIQFPLIAQLRDEGKVTVQTLAESGRWFSGQYKLTPATSVTALEDLPGESRKTVWFNSRYYRANLLWQDGGLRFRDIHQFNEELKSSYYSEKVTSSECSFFTLPVMDGYLWSSKTKQAGIWFKAKIQGKEVLLKGSDPVVSDSIPGKLIIRWPLKNVPGMLIIELDETSISFSMQTVGSNSIDWFLLLDAAENAPLPFVSYTNSKLKGWSQGMGYTMDISKGQLGRNSKDEVCRFIPTSGRIRFGFGD